jgi:hypothetical protein
MQCRELRYSKESASKLPQQPDCSRHLYGQPYVVAGRTLLLSRQGTQQGYPLGMLLFALAIKPLVLRIQSECELELNLRYADDGTLVGSVAEVAKAYQILKDKVPKYCFFLVPHKASLLWLTMDCARLLVLFDCRLDVDVHDLPLLGIVLVGSLVDSDEFVMQHLSTKSAKVDVILGIIADMDNAQTATSLLPLGRPLHVRFQEYADGADAPSSCDVGQAATIYRPLATHPTPSYDGAAAPGRPTNQGRWTRAHRAVRRCHACLDF